MKEYNNTDHTDLEDYSVFRPAWRSFGVYFFGAALFLAGPMVNPQAAIRPSLSHLLATLCLAYILLRRFCHLYRIEGGRLTVLSKFPGSQKNSVSMEKITRIDLRRGLSQRLLGVAHVYIYVEDKTEPALKLFGVPNPYDFKRLLLKLGADDKAVTGAWRR